MKSEIETVGDASVEATDFSPFKQKIRDYIEVLKNGGGEPAEAPVVSPALGQAVDAIADVVEPENTPVENKEEKDDSIVTVKVFFEDGCQMENLRALILLNAIREDCEYIECYPADIETNPDTSRIIVDEGFIIKFKSQTTPEDIYHIENALNVKSYEVIDNDVPQLSQSASQQAVVAEQPKAEQASTQSVQQAPVQQQQATPQQTAQATASATAVAEKPVQVAAPAQQKAPQKSAAETLAQATGQGKGQQNRVLFLLT